MTASLMQASFEVWDVTMQDLLDNKVTFDRFRGVIFPGGFSYAGMSFTKANCFKIVTVSVPRAISLTQTRISDVLGSAKGWAASLLFHPSLEKQLKKFVSRVDTFSLGVCNGCQLMSLLGWIGNETGTYR